MASKGESEMILQPRVGMGSWQELREKHETSLCHCLSLGVHDDSRSTVCTLVVEEKQPRTQMPRRHHLAVLCGDNRDRSFPRALTQISSMNKLMPVTTRADSFHRR